MTTPQQLSEFVRSRHSPRQFLPKPIPAPVLRQVLIDAQSAPSNSNTQPWNVHIVSGATKERVTQAMIADLEAGKFHPDFNTDYGTDTYLRRSQELAASTYLAQGVARNDTEGRVEVIRKNLRFYDAPHAVFLFMPMMGDGIRASGDLGMYAQNFLLSLTAHGYHGIPLASAAMFPDTVREILGVPAEFKLQFALAIGKGDPTSPLYNTGVGRAPLSESVTLHDTPGVL